MNISAPNIFKNPQPWIVIFVVLNIFLLMYLLLGFGILKTDKGAATFYINNNRFTDVNKIKLRPGVYTIQVFTKDTAPYSEKIFALPFFSKTIQLEPIKPFDAFVSARNAPSDAKDYTTTAGEFLENNTWFVGTFRTIDGGAYYVAAIQYVYGEWQIRKIIPSNDTLSDDTSALPDSIVPAFNSAAGSISLD